MSTGRSGMLACTVASPPVTLIPSSPARAWTPLAAAPTKTPPWRKEPVGGTYSAATLSTLTRQASRDYHHDHRVATRRRRSADAWAAVAARPRDRRRRAGHCPSSTLGPHRGDQSAADRGVRRPGPVHAG